MSKATLTLKLWDDRNKGVLSTDDPDLQVSTGDEGQFELKAITGDRVMISSEQALSLSRFLASNAKQED